MSRYATQNRQPKMMLGRHGRSCSRSSPRQHLLFCSMRNLKFGTLRIGIDIAASSKLKRLQVPISLFAVL